MAKKSSILPSNKIVIRYCIVATVLMCLIAFSLPYLLNYPPESINTQFDIDMSYISYNTQLLAISLLGLGGITGLIKVSFKDIDKWYKLPSAEKYRNKQFIHKLRDKCFKLPFILFLFELLIPIVAAMLVLQITGSHYDIMLFKLMFLIISFSLFLSISSYVFSKDLYAEILVSLYNKNIRTETKTHLYSKFFFQVMPIPLIILLLSSLVGYTKSVAEKEDVLFTVYQAELSEAFDVSKTYTKDEMIKTIDSVHLYNSAVSGWFIIEPDQNIISSGNIEITEFIIKYTQELAPKYGGKTYDSYGKDIQGTTLMLHDKDGETYYVGVLYSVSADIAIKFLLYNFIFGFLLMIVMLHEFSRSLANDLKTITSRLKNIAEDTDTKSFEHLPITSNDEIGEMIYAFNNIQDLTKSHITEINNNQEVLIEKERLATLGQMIGGIAHNLKTPIMSISGAREALQDLIREYDASIGDPEVTNEDHHEIAKEMQEWTEKIKTHLAYMSDIITAVKGQAVNMSATSPSNFTVYEVLKQVDILMKHELKNALITLNIDCKVADSTELKGNITSLVQVINNIISNAIQSYAGEPHKNIDLSVFREGNNLIISIKDHGSGMSKSVQSKLFNSMITTKGKNGTGLGLFMSYSNIKAHFDGNITFESEEGKGTTFYIHLPLQV